VTARVAERAPDVAAPEGVIEDATCLGCGCACDDITVIVRAGRIAEARAACALGRAWFGDGTAPARARSGGRDVGADTALADAARLLDSAARPLVYLATDLSCEAQRAAAAIADRLGAMLDSLTTDTVAVGILAAQRRGRATATLGEIRHRADVMVFWGVDPDVSYPRYTSRYAPLPAGMHIGGGRAARAVVAVDIGPTVGPSDADVRMGLSADEELDAIAWLRMLVKHGDARYDGRPELAELSRRLLAARYAVIVYDAEPVTGRDPGRAEGLIALVQELNAFTRAAVSALRGGGNRSGADAVLMWQTGFPMAVDFARGTPRYRPHEGARATLARGDVDVALVAGRADGLPAPVGAALAGARVVCIGPFATSSAVAAEVAIDGGVAGIHEGGSAVRMDDVPLPLRPALDGPPSTAGLLRALAARLGTRRGA
jgi:formylmethanofuran dehydrogenase subunit B